MDAAWSGLVEALERAPSWSEHRRRSRRSEQSRADHGAASSSGWGCRGRATVNEWLVSVNAFLYDQMALLNQTRAGSRVQPDDLDLLLRGMRLALTLLL